MKSFWIVPAIVGLCAVATADLAWGQDAQFAGRWRWNRTESTIAPGEPVPKDIVTEIASADRTRIRWTVTITDPHDGQPHPVQGNAAGDTASFTLSPGGLQAVFRSKAGETDTVTCTLSGDHRKMTCKGTVAEAKGQTSSYVDVYDRL
jgi:hypothetical protein